MAEQYLCLHAHFCQLPRGGPMPEETQPAEWEGDLYADIKEKAVQRCYLPNAELGNFELMSFDLGNTMGRWLATNVPNAYQRILAADQLSQQQWSAGNALAQPLHHLILPLARRSNKRLQVLWGLTAFAHRFGRPAEGLWLPDMAVDLETLQILYDTGIRYTLLAGTQVHGPIDGAGPYWVRLPSGDRLAVFVRDDWHSNELAFNVRNLGGAGRWARGTLAPLRWNSGRLLLLALDGETFGYYHHDEEHFLHWLLKYEAGAVGYKVLPSLGRYLRDNPPQAEIEVNEHTAWNCSHGLARWSVGCECTPGASGWKHALRQAFNNLAEQLDAIYCDRLQHLHVDSDKLLEHYIRIRLGEITMQDLLRLVEASHLTTPQISELQMLLLAQYHCQRAFVSYAFFYEDLSRMEPRYAIANAARTVMLVSQATGDDLGAPLRRDLAQAVSQHTGQTGAQIFDDILLWAQAYIKP